MKQEVLCLVLLGCGLALAANPCCPDGMNLDRLTRRCGRFNMTSLPALDCPEGKLLLRDIVLHGDKVTTMDAPEFVIVEDPTQYCTSYMIRNASRPELGMMPVALACFQKDTWTNNLETSGILTLVSVFFLVATIAVYSYLPQMRDLQGMCYLCTCISMALGFLSLGMLQLNPGFRNEICTVTGFLVYAWMIATFFWMNVICINTYRTVMDAAYLQKTEKKQFFSYSCYAWGFTMLFLIVALITNFSEGNHWKPGFGDGNCWFNGRTETWIFFYGPIAILVTSNVVLFGLSSYNLWQQTKKYEVNKLNNLRHRFLLSLKLFLVMGISWIFEIASFAHGEAHIIWKIMDTFNCLQGVIIFLLLVLFRRRAIRGLANENFCVFITRPLAEKLSPHDDEDDQHILGDETVEVRLN
ncbi:probable G-protein coupled receptor Mth-like 3 isoform X1 [Ostrinia furnacalis]|uniref:probable G-protein coupled receptor Mth-like 3 isoform X1 n=1 Tax=Ostrinia furnacalis TaxID=93504 RepID=UPI00103F467B|nr:probable G-protein coupled receptor Mth-like 3 isoform X1 [Ostrinia furnacalis]